MSWCAATVIATRKVSERKLIITSTTRDEVPKMNDENIW